MGHHGKSLQDLMARSEGEIHITSRINPSEQRLAPLIMMGMLLRYAAIGSIAQDARDRWKLQPGMTTAGGETPVHQQWPCPRGLRSVLPGGGSARSKGSNNASCWVISTSSWH